MSLTSKQEKFAQCVADGMSQADAYRASYNCAKSKPESVQQLASRLMADVKVSSRVEELRKALAEKKLWERADSVKWLKKALQLAAQRKKPTEMVSSIRELNSMHGFNTPDIIIQDHRPSFNFYGFEPDETPA